MPARPRLSERCLARLHFVDGRCRVMLHDVETGDVIEIGPREWVLLAGADGTRDVEGLRLNATRDGVEVTREALTELLESAHRAGMLDGGPAPRRRHEAEHHEHSHHEHAHHEHVHAHAHHEHGQAHHEHAHTEHDQKRYEGAEARPIVRLPGYAFHCDGHGSCCQLYATVVFSPLEAARARSVRPDILDAGDRHEHAFMPERGAGPCAGSAVALVDGRCAYLDGALCSLHKAAGPASKPLGCNLFPLALVDDGTRVRASVAVECACVLASLTKPGGAPILAEDLRVRGDLDPAIVVDELPREVTIAGDVRAKIADYLAWSDAALAALDPAADPARDGSGAAADPARGGFDAADPALAAWALADAIEAHGLDVGRAAAVIRDAPLVDEARAARWLAALSAKASRRAKAQNAWRSPKDLCRRGVSIVAAAASLLSDPDVLAAVAAGAGAAPLDEAFYLRVALFGHQMVGYPLAVALRDRAVAIWVARAFALAAEALYPGEEEPAFEHPLALVEALLRGHGLRRYTDDVAREHGGPAAS